MLPGHEERRNFYFESAARMIAAVPADARPSDEDAASLAKAVLFPARALPIPFPVSFFAMRAATNALAGVVKLFRKRAVDIAVLAFGPASLALVYWMVISGYFSSYWKALYALVMSLV